MTWACLENSFDNFRPQKAIAGNITESCWLSPLRGESGQGRGVKINSQIFSQLLIKISVLIFLFMTRAECAEWERVRDIKRLHINNISPGLSYRDCWVTVFAPCLAECYLHWDKRCCIPQLRMPPRGWTNIYEARLKTSNYNLADKKTRRGEVRKPRYLTRVALSRRNILRHEQH